MHEQVHIKPPSLSEFHLSRSLYVYLVTGKHKAICTLNSVSAYHVNVPLVKCLVETVNFLSVCPCQQETMPVALCVHVSDR